MKTELFQFIEFIKGMAVLSIFTFFFGILVALLAYLTTPLIIKIYFWFKY